MTDRTRLDIENARDAKLWQLVTLTAPPDMQYLDPIREQAEAMASETLGPAGDGFVEEATKYLGAAVELAKAGVPLNEVPGYLVAVERLAENDLDVDTAVSALAGTAAAVGHAASVTTCLAAVLATVRALR
jgi:hypothetical protein